eukprot:263541-Pelagomonas_calceolata.AAC.1
MSSMFKQRQASFSLSCCCMCVYHFNSTEPRASKGQLQRSAVEAHGWQWQSSGDQEGWGKTKSYLSQAGTGLQPAPELSPLHQNAPNLTTYMRADIASIFWTRVTRGCQLGVRVKEGATHNFVGFRERVRAC